MEKKKKARDNPAGLAIPAGLFIGMGIGFMQDNIVPWLFIGLGVGFLVMLVVSLSKKRKN